MPAALSSKENGISTRHSSDSVLPRGLPDLAARTSTNSAGRAYAPARSPSDAITAIRLEKKGSRAATSTE